MAIEQVKRSPFSVFGGSSSRCYQAVAALTVKRCSSPTPVLHSSKKTLKERKMRKYLVLYSQAHDSFRLPELTSIAELHGFGHTMKVTLPDDLPDGGREASTLDDSKTRTPRPFVIVELESEDQARLLAQRCILIKSVRRTKAYFTSIITKHVYRAPVNHKFF